MCDKKFKIEIPKPCHEDWNKMTPDAKGAFCGSCVKSVYDFTNKTDDEIADVFMKNKDAKICGRFNASQVSKPMDIKVPLNQLPRNLTPFRAFAMAIFLVFGTMLFSCQTSNGQVMGDVAIEIPIEKNTVKGEMKITGDTTFNLEKMPMMGKPKFTPQDTAKKTTKCIKPEIPEPKMMGEMMWIPEDTAKQIPPVTPVDTVIDEPLMGKVAFVPVHIKPNNNNVTDTTKKVPLPPAVNVVKMGMVQYIPEVEEPKNITITIVDTANNKLTGVPELKPVELVVFPNPSNGEISIRYTVVENANASIELFDMKGKKVKTLFTSPKLYAGIYTTTFNISDLPNGNYFCTLKSGEKTSTVKLTMAK